MTEPRELWAKAPAALITDPEMTLGALRVYLWLDLRAGKRGYWYGTQPDIITALDIARRTVTSAVTLLVNRGYITSERSGRPNGETTYRLAARMSTQARIPQGSDAQFAARGCAVERASDRDARSLTTDPSLDPVKTRTRARTTRGGKSAGDWDQIQQRHQAKIDGLTA